MDLIADEAHMVLTCFHSRVDDLFCTPVLRLEVSKLLLR